jgi:FtsH-binding integral membrane protein
MKGHKWLFWTSLGFTLGLSMAMFCFNKLAKRVPINYITLAVFTFFSSYMIAGISIFQDSENVIIAMALTLAVFFSLTVLTFFVPFLF